jgi:hypothetical protein
MESLAEREKEFGISIADFRLEEKRFLPRIGSNGYEKVRIRQWKEGGRRENEGFGDERRRRGKVGGKSEYQSSFVGSAKDQAFSAILLPSRLVVFDPL